MLGAYGRHKIVTVSSQFVTAFNSTDRPAVVSDEGHILGGREYGTVDSKQALVKRHIDLGVLAVIDDPGDELDGMAKEPKAAIKATRDANGEADKPAARHRTAPKSDAADEKPKEA